MDGHRPLPGLTVDWRLIVAVGLWSLTGTAAILLTARAMAGAFDNSVTAVVPGLVTAIANIGSLGARELFRLARQPRIPHHSASGRQLVIGLVSLTPPALIAWATTVSASPLAAGIVMGILVLGLTFVVVSEGVRFAPPPALGRFGDSVETIATSAIDVPNESAAERFSALAPALQAELVQQLSRRREADGECIEAVVQATFAPGERETVVHLPIHPVLRGTPQVECEPLDDSAVSTAVTAAHPYGVRIEVKRTSTNERPLSVPIGIEIRSTQKVADVA